MFSASKLGAIAALVSLAAIPRVRAADISVTVGGPGVLRYNPPSVDANVGDTVTFNFMQVNHTATQSTLANPCVPMPGGFDSGFVPVAASNTAGPFPQAKFTVKDTNPVWVFCRQANHCQQGMVFAINPGNNLAQFQAAATGGSAPAASATAPAASGTAAAGVVTVTATVTVSGQALTTTYGSYPGSAAPTNAISTDHKVVVGGSAGLVYTPSNITAQPGDTVTFQFQAKNHTVVQSSFNTPCRSLTSTSTSGQIGFDSGFMPVAANATTFPTFVVQVNDTAPIWVYCKQSGHCGSGMVFSINAVESGTNTFEAFKAKAIQQNGTSTSTSSSSTTSPTSGATSLHGAGSALAFVAGVVGFLL